MPLSSTLICASLRRRRLVAAGPGDGPAQPIDRRLVVGLDRAHRRARAREQRPARSPVPPAVIVRAGAVATAMVTVRSRAAARRRRSTGNLDAHRLLARVLLEHFGAQPGDAADDEQQLADHRREAEVDRIAASAPSMFSGIGLIRSRDRRFERAREADAVAGEAGVLGERRTARDARIDRRVHAMAEPGQPRFAALRPRRPAAAAAASNDSAVAPRAIEARRDQLHAARAGAAVLVADREHAGGDRRRRATAGCPTRRAAPPRTTARRRRGRRRRSGSRRAAGAPPADGSRS